MVQTKCPVQKGYISKKLYKKCPKSDFVFRFKRSQNIWIECFGILTPYYFTNLLITFSGFFSRGCIFSLSDFNSTIARSTTCWPFRPFCMEIINNLVKWNWPYNWEAGWGRVRCKNCSFYIGLFFRNFEYFVVLKSSKDQTKDTTGCDLVMFEFAPHSNRNGCRSYLTVQ